MTAVEFASPVLSEPSPARIQGLGLWLRDLRERSIAFDPGPHRHLVVTPLGLPWRARLGRALSDLGVPVFERRTLAGWPSVSTALHVVRTDRESLRRAALFEDAWASLFPAAPCEAWSISPESHAILAGVKRRLRAGMGNLRVELGRPPLRPAWFHPFHLADPEDAIAEARRLAAVVALAQPGGAYRSIGRYRIRLGFAPSSPSRRRLSASYSW